MEQRGREVIEGVATGQLQRSGQFALGLEQPWFEEVFLDPALLDLVAEALGPNLGIASWRILMKDHHFDGPINVHQDWPYFGGDTRKLNVFIPMTPVGVENGGLVFYERSHFYGPLERGDIDVSRYASDLTTTCPELQVGDVLLADFLTWHYSAPARQAKDRILFQLVFQPADDPSSAHVVRGVRSHPFLCPDRYTALSEPLSQMNVQVGRAHLDAGQIERAERFARGMLASDPQHVGAAVLLHDVLKKGGDEAGADVALSQARAGLETLEGDIAARVVAVEPSPAVEPSRSIAEAERIAALEREVAQMKASRSWRWTTLLRRR